MSEKPSETPRMNAMVEATSLVRQLSKPSPAGDSTKGAIQRAWRKVHDAFTPNRVKDLWYADPRVRVSADELERLRRAVQDRVEEEDARAALKSVAARLTRLEALIQGDAAAARAVDPAMVGGRGALDRPLDRRRSVIEPSSGTSAEPSS